MPRGYPSVATGSFKPGVVTDAKGMVVSDKATPVVMTEAERKAKFEEVRRKAAAFERLKLLESLM